MAARMGVALLLATMIIVSGCARTGSSGGPTIPERVLSFTATYRGPVSDLFHYFVALDADGDFGVDGPLPVAAGPYWGNGWGTGSITHFVQYHQGQYDLFRVDRTAELRQAGAGITAASGEPTSTDTGEYRLTTGALTLGDVTVSAAGAIASVTNQSDQNAGTLTVETDAAGTVVAGSVAFSPAGDGGRALTAAERAALDALNAGGIALAPGSLAALGLQLALKPAGSRAGQATLQVEPATAAVAVVFRPTGGGGDVSSTATLTANTSTPTGTPPIPGARLTAADLLTGGTAVIGVQTTPTSTLIGPPFEWTPPAGTHTLAATIDLAPLGNPPSLSVNIISTTDLIFDPTITDPDEHVYDAIGLLGNDFVSFSTTQDRTITSNDSLNPEAANDPTLAGPPSRTQADRDAVDLVDWSLTVRRLR